jgi:hypothetical protein
MSNRNPERGSRIQGSRVASIELAENHSIEFYEHQPGLTAIVESGRIGSDSVLEKDVRDKSLLETYRELTSRAPGRAQHDETLKRLEEADTRAARLSAKVTKSLKSEISVTPLQNAPDTKSAPVIEGIKTQSLMNEDWDWSADAQWFLSNFFWGGGPSWTNVVGFGRHYAPETWKADFVTMNASFDGWTHVLGYGKVATNYLFWTSYSYNLWYDSWIAPRHWKRWSYRYRLLGFKIETDGSPRYHHAASWQ